MAAKFYALLTARGEARLAQAAALGTQINITKMAVGDGGGTLPTPDATQTTLVNEVRRAGLNLLTVDPLNPSQIIAEQVIPENEGGWWIREIGLYDDAGELIAVANCAETYKPLLAEGSGRVQTLRMILIVSSTDAVTLKIDPSVILATRKYVDDKVIEVKAYADDLMKAHLAAADPHTQYAPKKDPVLTGTPKAPTAANGNNTTQLATTAFVQAAISLLKGDAPLTLDTLAELAGAINNDPNFYNTMANQLALKAALANPTFTGTPKAPTAAASNNTTQLATTAFVQSAIAQLVASSPASLDTLKELADALGDDPNFATTMTNLLALKAPLASPALTGKPTAPTAGSDTSSTQIATTAFVQALLKAHMDAADPHSQYLITKNWFSEYASINDTTRKNLLGNIGAAGKAFTLDSGVTRLDDASVTSKTQFVTVSGTIEDGPQGNATYAATLLNIRRVYDAGTSLTQLMFSGGVIYLRTANGGEGGFEFGATALNENGWRRVYDEYNPPTAEETHAVPSRGTLPDSANLNTMGPSDYGLWVKNNTAGGTEALNFPGNDPRGFFEIIPGGRFLCTQQYTIWTGAVYTRSLAGNWNGKDGPWSAWKSNLIDVNALSEIKALGASAQQSAQSNLGIDTGLVPVGIPMPWPTVTAPSGWLKCNGAAFSASAYPELAKVYPSLKLPDLRGEFIRGWDDGRGADSGRSLLSGQSAMAGTFTVRGVNIAMQASSSGTPMLDALYFNETTTVNDNTNINTVAITPGDNRPRNIAFNYIVRAA